MLTLTYREPKPDSCDGGKRTKQHPLLQRIYPPIALRELLPCWVKLVYPVDREPAIGHTFMRCGRADADAVQFHCLHCGQREHQSKAHEIRLCSPRVPITARIAWQEHIWDVPGRFEFIGEQWDALTISPRLEPLECKWSARIEAGIVVSIDRFR